MNLADNHIFSLIWLAFGKVLAVTVVTMISQLKLFKKRVIYTSEIVSKEQSRREWRGTLLVATDAVVLFCAAYLGLIKFARETFLNGLLTVLEMILWVDFWMYFTHRWMHWSPLLWRAHRHHHLSRVVQPVTAISFSLVEKFFFYSVGWIGGIALISWVLPVTYYGIVTYFSLYFFLSAASHGNIAYFDDHLEILQSPAIHGLHHLRPSANYGFWTTFYDRVFRTYVSPSKEFVHRRPRA